MKRAGGIVPVLAAAYALLVAATLGYFLLRIPIQLNDGFSNMVDVLNGSLGEIFMHKASNHAYFRPLMWPPYRLVMDLSAGNPTLWFRTLHVAQLGVLLLLFVRWLRIRTWTDLAALPLGVAMLVGGHTFSGTVMEAFPINHFLAVVIACVGAATLAAEPRRRVNDLLAMLVFAYAALTIESGLLVWVTLAAAYGLGARGVSRGAVLTTTAGVVAYLAIRLVVLKTGSPDLLERTSGFGFSALSPEDAQRMFGAHPARLYLYNVVSALSGTLFAEPRGGLWRLVRSLVTGTPELWTRLNVACATGSVVLVAWFGWTRRVAWRQRELTARDRIVLLAPVMLVANAAFSYAYVKDVVMAPAGAFLAAAGFVAMREALDRVRRIETTAGALACALVLGLLSYGWAVKQAGVHYAVRRMNVAIRREWVEVDEFLKDQHVPLDTPVRRSLKTRLEQDALTASPPAPWPPFPWSPRWFDENQ